MSNDLVVELAIELAKKAAKEEQREKAYKAIVAKIEKEYPIRQKLAKLLGRKLADETIRELFVDILIFKPEHDNHARQIIQGTL